MKFTVLNPNTTQAMTDAVLAELAARLPADATLVGLTSRTGSPVIDSRETFALGAASAAAMLPEVPHDSDAILLACFGDPGLAALRRASNLPVVGLAQAAMDVARAQGQRFAIITAGANWVDMLRECAAGHGAAGLLVGVYALNGNGGQLLKNPDAFRAQLAALSTQAADDGARMLVLGGAAFAGLRFTCDARLTLVDAMDAAVGALVGNAGRVSTVGR
ncbi:MAG: Asp/Glu/hydantoin racemase [Rhodoferax sp.]|nr:Asp/Glu/hydantoin racemase [Rhodoferax sp.]